MYLVVIRPSHVPRSQSKSAAPQHTGKPFTNAKRRDITFALYSPSFDDDSVDNTMPPMYLPMIRRAPQVEISLAP